MIELFQMWALVEALGIVCLPLTLTVFHNLPDRGWAFNKAIGAAVLTFAVWFPLACLHFLPFSRLFIGGALLLLIALNVVGFLRVRHELLKFVRVNLPYIVMTEVIFLGMVFLLGWIRSYGPDIRSFEMFMDEGFIASIMRSPHLPLGDMWYAGQPINYYYYAHFIIAMLAKLLGQIPSVAFNTGICIYYGMTAVTMFGVACNIVTWARYARARAQTGRPLERPDVVLLPLWRAFPYGVMAFVMGLILGNLAATQQWWTAHGDLMLYNWFLPSRVIDKTINEFPAFSFLLSCFHAHVLTLAFTIVAIAMAFNLFLAADGPGARGLLLFGRGWRLPLTLGVTALILGGLFAMNGWDYPTYMGLTLICLVLQQWRTHNSRLSRELALNVCTAGGALIALSLLLYAPFYLNFISPSEGIGIVDAANRSSIHDELLIYGIFAFVYLSLLVASTLKRPAIATFPGALSATPRGETLRQRLTYAAFAGIGLFFLVGLATLFFLGNSTTLVMTGSIAILGAVLVFYTIGDRSQAFTLLLGAIAFGLVAFCELFFLRDAFVGIYPRMNTVFKFYFQAWALLAITSGTGLYFILDGFGPLLAGKLKQQVTLRSLELCWGIGLLLLLISGAAYPIAGTYARTNFFMSRTNSLDGLNYLQTDPSEPGDYQAIRWINANIQGDPVIVEAVGPDYSNYARISAFTGLPTIMGWVGHEYQWRLNWLNKSANAIDFNRRSADVDAIYTDSNPQTVLSTMARYDAQYLYVGPLEYQKYPSANLSRFKAFMQVVYSAHGVTIYKVRDGNG